MFSSVGRCVLTCGGIVQFGISLAVGETVILPHPPCPCSRCFNRDEEGVSAKLTELPAGGAGISGSRSMNEQW